MSSVKAQQRSYRNFGVHLGPDRGVLTLAKGTETRETGVYRGEATDYPKGGFDEVCNCKL